MEVRREPALVSPRDRYEAVSVGTIWGRRKDGKDARRGPSRSFLSETQVTCASVHSFGVRHADLLPLLSRRN
jgi:hypothetical protein